MMLLEFVMEDFLNDSTIDENESLERKRQLEYQEEWKKQNLISMFKLLL